MSDDMFPDSMSPLAMDWVPIFEQFQAMVAAGFKPADALQLLGIMIAEAAKGKGEQ
jgi:hypothetical protein